MDELTTVQVYKNLHNGMWSVRILDSGPRLVVAHACGLVLSSVVFKVNENGRQRVLRECRKNVHAFAEGTLEQWCGDNYKERHLPKKIKHGIILPPMNNSFSVSYNPYKLPYFYRKDTLDEVKAAKIVYFANGTILANSQRT